MKQGFNKFVYLQLLLSNLIFRFLLCTNNKKIKKELIIIERNKDAVFLIYINNYIAFV